MSNLQHITSKIKNDSEVQKNAILAKANEEARNIINKRISAAEKKAADILEKAQAESVVKKNRIISSAQLKVRNEKLEAKQNVIENIFITTKQNLNNMSVDDFKSFVKNKVLSLDIIGNENIIVNANGKEVLDDIFISELNNSLIKIGKEGNLKISKTTGDFAGGFIIEKDGIEINNTFESLVESLREEMEFEIARIMFS